MVLNQAKESSQLLLRVTFDPMTPDSVLPQPITWPPIKISLNGIQIITMSNLFHSLWSLLPHPHNSHRLSFQVYRPHLPRNNPRGTRNWLSPIVHLVNDSLVRLCGRNRGWARICRRPILMSKSQTRSTLVPKTYSLPTVKRLLRTNPVTNS